MIGLLLLGCGSQSFEPTFIDSLRVVAVTASPPVVTPSMRVQTRAFVANPDGMELASLSWTCVATEDLGCLEAQVYDGPQDWIVVSTALGSSPAIALDDERRAPPDPDNLFDAYGSRLDVPLFTLVCELGACPIITEAARAIDQGFVDGRLMRMLSDPATWLADIEMDRSALSVRTLILQQDWDGWSNQNPVFEARFLEASDATFQLSRGEVDDLSFAVDDPDVEVVYLYPFTTAGRFAERWTKAKDGVGRVWLEAPSRPAEGHLWVVFDDRDGGVAVYDQALSVR